MLRVLPRCTCRNASATSLPRFRPFSSTRPAFASSVPVSLNGRRYRVAIVGAGPAGFYAASRLLGTHGAENVRVDMYEELPVPFGLVRYGVAPDHPEVKNCIHKFEESALDPRFRFFGNVQIGGPSSRLSKSEFSAPSPTSDTSSAYTSHALSIPLSFLRPYYHSVLFTYGASQDRSLGPSVQNDDSPDLSNVLSARSFVHWYNGHPHSPFHSSPEKTSLDLSKIRHASIIGQGNVALDCARILLSAPHKASNNSRSRLAPTDTPEPVLAALSKSAVQHIEVVGRRGPLQFAGTTKEVRELSDGLKKESGGDTAFVMSKEDKALVKGATQELKDFEEKGGKMESARMKKRLLGLMEKAQDKSTALCESTRSWSLAFCRSPVGLYSSSTSHPASGPVSSIRYELNDLMPVLTSTLPVNEALVDPSALVARGTGKTVDVQTDLVLKSVGYRSIGIEGVPFDERKGVVRNNEGRIVDEDGKEIPGLYVSGWLSRGPNGVIATTMYDAFQTGDLIAADLAASASLLEDLPPLPDLNSSGHGDQRVVGWSDWQAIDEKERKDGKKLGKEREKILTVQGMLQVLG